MNKLSVPFDPATDQAEQPVRARDWIKVLSEYRDPSTARSFFELGVTIGPFIALWALAWWALSINGWLALAISLANGAFVLRLFTIQHDCGHASFFKNRTLSNWVGRILGVLTLTPYDVWKRDHAMHHSASGNLTQRGIGDVDTLTVAEYRALSRFGQFKYRLYRNPIVLFGLGPGYLFFLRNRLPLGLMNQTRYWISAMGTNLTLLAALSVIWYFGGIMPILLIFLPSTLLAATTGVWLFYVQHQFETTHWEAEPEWDMHEAALQGSSHYVLPAPFQWLTANIGIHHVHHLYSRIPFYRLPEVLKNHEGLAQINRMTVRESLINARLHLWDEESKRLVSFAEARVA